MNDTIATQDRIRALLRDLEQNIRGELEAQLGIQALLDQQLDILVKGGTAKLPGILEQAESGIEASRKLEAERTKILQELAATVGKPVHQITLEWLETLSSEPSSVFHDLGEELKATVLRIREDNRTVHLLIRHSLLFIEDLIRAVAGSNSDRALATYTRRGRHSEAVQATGAEG